MTLQLDQVALDARDPERVAKFWAEVLDYKVSYDSATDPDNDSPEREIELSPRNGSTTMLLILENNDEKKVKNRLHFDLRPDDQEAEVARVEALGAKRVDIGQGDVTWVVLADPEGNEFCILRSKESSD